MALNNITTLKSGLEVTQGHWKRYHSKAWYGFYSHFIVTMVVSGVIFEINRNIGQISQFFVLPLHSTLPLVGFPSEYCRNVWYRKNLEWCGYHLAKKFEDMFSRFDTIPLCDRRTDRRTDILRWHQWRHQLWGTGARAPPGACASCNFYLARL